MILPGLMVLVAVSFLTLLITGQDTSAATAAYAAVMAVLTAINLWRELHGR